MNPQLGNFEWHKLMSTRIADPDRIRFSPSILPPYMRRSKSIETLLPMLYLKGISTGDFSEALAALLGKDAAGLGCLDRSPFCLQQRI